MHDPSLSEHIAPFYTCMFDLQDNFLCLYEHPIDLDEIEDISLLTNFTPAEVYMAFDLFSFHTRNTVYSPRTGLWLYNDGIFKRIASLWSCPFTDRFMSVYSHRHLCMTFDDWLDIFNAFHKRTPLEFKLEAAFRLYDFDDDGYLSIHDVIEYLRRMTDGELHEYDYYDVAEYIVYHYDYDEDGVIGLTDFKLGMQKDNDFKYTFKLSVRFMRDLREF